MNRVAGTITRAGVRQGWVSFVTGSLVVRAVLGGGLTAGVLDLADAVVVGRFNGAGPVRVAQSIASGLLGRAAYAGGWRSAVLGVLLHLVIALGAATVYVVASRAVPALWRRPLLCGAVYGVAVFLFMYGVVLPLAGLHAWPRRWPLLANAVFAHVCGVGLPIALWARYSRLR